MTRAMCPTKMSDRPEAFSLTDAFKLLVVLHEKLEVLVRHINLLMQARSPPRQRTAVRKTGRGLRLKILRDRDSYEHRMVFSNNHP